LFDINSLLWIIPRREDRGDEIIVFKILEEEEIGFFITLTSFLRGQPICFYSYLRGLIFMSEYPDLEIYWALNFVGKLCDDLKGLPEEECKALDERLDSFMLEGALILMLKIRAIIKIEFSAASVISECLTEMREETQFRSIALLRRF
jgi:hypothetical protein